MFKRTAADRPNQTFRLALITGSLLVLVLWIWAWVPVFAAYDDPNENGFVIIPGVMATFTLLPLGSFALFNAVRGGTRDVRDARTALIIVAAILVVAGGIELHGNYLEAQDEAKQGQDSAK